MEIKSSVQRVALPACMSADLLHYIHFVASDLFFMIVYTSAFEKKGGLKRVEIIAVATKHIAALT